ncbi:Nuclear transport factor 2 [Artemisia annua]|uniref:Nuclear transport factor 2 n=1 Tax=Artemisia annua TaxID=35608 RepID=A0A2U1NIU5_ARTAN|nr:Nuclear transport factor 2 [Artemisia annua]
MENNSKSSSTNEIMDIEKGQDEKNLPSDPQDEVEENESYTTILTKPSLPTKTGSSSTASAKPSTASKNIDKTIYVKNVPLEATRRTLTSAVKKFGNVKHRNIQIKSIWDRHRYAFIEFNTQKAAKQAVEAGYIEFDGYKCEVEYKKGDTQGHEGLDRSTGSSRGSVGDTKGGDTNGKGNSSKHVV